MDNIDVLKKKKNFPTKNTIVRINSGVELRFSRLPYAEFS